MLTVTGTDESTELPAFAVAVAVVIAVISASCTDLVARVPSLWSNIQSLYNQRCMYKIERQISHCSGRSGITFETYQSRLVSVGAMFPPMKYPTLPRCNFVDKQRHELHAEMLRDVLRRYPPPTFFFCPILRYILRL